jgi:hypothetical protein
MMFKCKAEGCGRECYYIISKIRHEDSTGHKMEVVSP